MPNVTEKTIETTTSKPNKLAKETKALEKKPEQDHITIKHDVLKKYFPKSYTPRQMEDQIIKLLDQWQKKRQREECL